VRFMLDPLAEYLGALQVLKDCGASNGKWSEFLAFAEECIRKRGTVPEFLIALRDCTLIDGSIPACVKDKLNEYV
jgi:hypothetical protein